MKFCWHFRIEFKAQDLWIGAYWDKDAWNIDIWLCLVPCLPFHIYRRLYSVEHG